MSDSEQYVPAVRDGNRVSISESLHCVLSAGWRRRRGLVVPIVLFPVLGFGVGLFAPRVYEAKMSVMVEDTGRTSPNLQDMAVASDLKERMDALRALLVSRRILLGVAQDIGVLKADASRAEQDTVVDGLAHAVKVELIGTEILQFTYRSSRSIGMAATLNRISVGFMERVMAPEVSSTRDSVEFLKHQLQAAENDVAKAENALGDFTGRNAQQLPEQRSSSVGRLSSMRDSLSDHEIRLAGEISEFDSLRARLAQTDPIIGHLDQDILAVTSELTNLRAHYTDIHSDVQAAERKLRYLQEMRMQMLQRAQVEQSADMDRLWNMAASSPGGSAKDGDGPPMLVSQVAALQGAKGKIEQTKAEIDNLRSSIQDLEKRLASSGEVGRQQAELERDRKEKGDLAADLRRRFEKARVSSELSRYQAPERVKVLDQPTDPVSPVYPVQLLFTLVGLLGGAVFGLGLVAAAETVDPSIRRAKEMEKIVGAPVLARIPPMVA